jgi:tricorn protease
MRLALPVLVLSLVLGVPARAGDAYVRFPTVHGDRVYFTAEGDLWRAPLAGGRATRLTTHPGQETRAAVSPDGKWLAFTASYEGPQEVYVMPVEGGLPKRLTFSGLGSFVLGWTPKGQVLFATSPDFGPSRSTVVATVDPATRVRTTLPLMDATEACLDPTGHTLFFTRLGLGTTGDHARHYRGGAAATLWRYDLEGGREAVQIPFEAPVKRPMVWKDRLIVVSDKGGVNNLWSLSFDGRDARQLTHHTRFEVQDATLGDGRVAYQLGADLHVFDLATGEDRTVPVTLTSDFDQERERVERKPLAYLEDVSLAPTGDRVLLTARGQLAVAGPDGLRRVRVDLPPGSRARAAVLSPDGKTVYAICDATGEQQIWRFPADGAPGGEALTTDPGRSRMGLSLAPDGKTLAHMDREGNLYLLDLATRANRRIDANELGSIPDVVWSPDGKTLAIIRNASPRHLSQILLHDVATGRQAVLTTDKYDSFSPAFTPDGKWLYFLSDRTFQVVNNGGPWGDRNLGPYFDRRTKIYALALQAGDRFPFAPKTELESPEVAPKAEKEAKAASEKAELPPIAWAGLEGRLYEVPLAAGNYQDLRTDGKRLYFLEREGKARALKTLEIGNAEAPAGTFAAGVTGFDLSADRKKVLLVKRGPGGPSFYVVPAGAKAPGALGKSEIKLADWTLLVSPRQEWHEMFEDAWRMHRDQFFDHHMRGLDWVAIRQKYEPLVDRVTDRAELTDLLGQMMGELGALHSQARPGDLRHGEDGSVQAYLGGVFSRQAGGYRLDHLYRTEAELPSEAGPLSAPGLDIREGDVLVAVNGQPTREARDLSDLLRNEVGQQVLLAFTREGKALQPVVVTAVGLWRQRQLRYTDWEEGLRRRVEKASHGRIGYLHLRAMGPQDIDTFAREFYGQVDRDGLILDVRRNDGGNIDSWVIEKLLRRAWEFWTDNAGHMIETNMQQTFRGHLVVLADEETYSDGETFTAGIKALHVGPVVGRRTAGAGAWLTDSNVLEDRGQLRAAEWPQYLTQDGTWIIEGRGVSPDVDVLNLPHETYEGRDRQLDTAIQLLLDQLAKDPVKPLVPQGVPPLK